MKWSMYLFLVLWAVSIQKKNIHNLFFLAPCYQFLLFFNSIQPPGFIMYLFSKSNLFADG